MPQAYYSGSPADLLKGRQYTAGIRIFDIAHPEAPREIAFMATEGMGPHRIWYVGGRYAYVSIHYPEFTDQVLAIVDVRSRPGPRSSASGGSPECGRAAARRRVGQREAATRCTMLSSPATSPMPPGAMAGSPCSTSADPTRPKLLAHRNLDPPFGGGTHSPLPLPDRTSWCSPTRPILQLQSGLPPHLAV